MKYLNISSIENVKLKENKNKNSNSKQLNEQEINNIKSVISFLNQKQPKFDVLIFDFTNIKNIETSTILFYKTFLDLYFIKSTQQKMYERCIKLLSTNGYSYENDKKKLRSWNLYASLLFFYKNGNVHFNFKKNDYLDFTFTSSLSRKLKIPFILNDPILKMFSPESESEDDVMLPFPIFYQLQFIFDAIDSLIDKHFIVETLLKIRYDLEMIKMPDIKDIAASLNAKKQFFNLRLLKSNQYLEKKNSKFNIDYFDTEKEKQDKKTTKLSTFNERNKLNKDKLNEKNVIESNVNTSEIEDFDQFWV